MTDSATQPNSKMAKCPFCGEEINVEAIKCRYCGEFIDQYAVKKTREECKEVALDKPVGEQSTWRKFCMLDTRRNKQKLILVITGMIVLFIGFYIHEHGGIPWINRKTVSIDSLQKGCVRLINEEIHTRICENYGKDWIPIHVQGEECPFRCTECKLIKESEYTYSGIATMTNSYYTIENGITCTYSGDGNLLVKPNTDRLSIMRQAAISLPLDFKIEMIKHFHSIFCEPTIGALAKLHLIDLLLADKQCLVQTKIVSFEQSNPFEYVAKVVLKTTRGHESQEIEFKVTVTETGGMKYEPQNSDADKAWIDFCEYCVSHEKMKVRVQ